MPDKPRSFKETVAAQEPADRARLANAESFNDVTVSNPFHQQVTVIEDRDGGEWRVEYFDDDGGCYVTAFAGLKPRSGRATISRRSSLDGCEPSERSSRRSPAPADMALPPGFVSPCLPTKAPRPPTGEAWLHEIKRLPHDG